MAIGVIREHWLCDDCTIAACNDDYSGISDEKRVTEVQAGIEAIGFISLDASFPMREGREWFTERPCDCCKTKLVGDRTRFATMGEV